MASYQLFLSFIVIFQFFNNSVAFNGDGQQLKIITPASGFNGITHYQYFETSDTNCLSFKIRADKDAHIALASAPNREEPWIEIVIGGWGNTKSVIRKDRDYEQTNVRLSDNEYKGFWITWNSAGEIRVGVEGKKEPFMSWNDTEPVNIKYFGVSLCWGSVGTWIIEEPSCPNLKKRPRNAAPQINGSFYSISIFLILICAIYKFF